MRVAVVLVIKPHGWQTQVDPRLRVAVTSQCSRVWRVDKGLGDAIALRVLLQLEARLQLDLAGEYARFSRRSGPVSLSAAVVGVALPLSLLAAFFGFVAPPASLSPVSGRRGRWIHRRDGSHQERLLPLDRPAAVRGRVGAA